MSKERYLNGYNDFILPDSRRNLLTIYKSLIKMLVSGKPDTGLLKEYSDVDKILFIYLDGVGYEKFKSILHPRIKEEVNRLSSIYPTTTANIVTSLTTLSPPQRHAVLEWNLYVPELGLLIEPLPMRTYHSQINDELCMENISPGKIIMAKRFFKQIRRKGIKIISFLRGYIASNCYSKYLFKDAILYPYINPTDLSYTIRVKLEEEVKPSIYYIYIEGVDSIRHLYGSNTPQYLIDLKYTMKILVENLCSNPIKGDDVLLVFTSDHGIVDVKRDNVIFLDKLYPSLKKYVRRDKKGLPLISGSPRNVYIHVKEGYIDRVFKKLKSLPINSLILSKDDIIRDLMKNPGKAAESRLGDIIILPRPDTAIWYRHYRGEMIRTVGLHGGLSPDEIDIPILFIRYNELCRLPSILV